MDKKDPYIGEIFKDRYDVVKKLGKGSYGLVYLVDDVININIKYIQAIVFTF